ncbi:MAG TPA: hypothetical protein VHN98_12640 [Acidimicrobiales bacterium]|nr:hypothetical protein [Acidimicrobiales bacterium]
MKGARVIRIDQRGGALADGRTVTVTLAVTTRAETLAISHAVAAGEITLVRTTGVRLPADTPDTYRAPAATTSSGG